MNAKLLFAAIGLGAGYLLAAAGPPKPDEPKQKAMVSKTERFDFQPGGTLRLRNSIGDLTVEAWDRPDVEITTIKSTKDELDTREREKATHDLGRVNVVTERRGNELVIATSFPRHRPFRVFYPLSGDTNFDLVYRIKAPANARIIADHTLGEVNIDGLVGDIQVTLAKGEILLHLPEQEYSIHAQSDFGSVKSDFSETEKRTRWVLGHRSVDENSAAHKLNLKVVYGDIVILKAHAPKSPEPVPPAPKAG